MERTHERVEMTDEVVRGYQAEFVTVGIIGHLIDRGFMDPGIRPLIPGAKVVGRAVTVSMPSVDTTANRRAVEAAEPGDVIIVDCGGDDRVSRWGELICFDAMYKGVAGLVIDGAISASGPIRAMGFPVFCRSITGLVGRRLNRDGAVGIPVQCGGVTVHPGDLIVADDDGAVVIPAAEAAPLLEQCRQRFGGGQKDSAKRWIVSGRPYAAFPGLGWEERTDLPAPARTPASERADAAAWLARAGLEKSAGDR